MLGYGVMKVAQGEPCVLKVGGFEQRWRREWRERVLVSILNNIVSICWIVIKELLCYMLEEIKGFFSETGV